MNLGGSESVAAHDRNDQLVGHLATDELVELWGRATSRIVKLGFAIEFGHLEPPKTGTFDGRRIVIDHVLVSPDVRVLAAEVRSTEMSDHAALLVDLEISLDRDGPGAIAGVPR